MDAEIGIIGGSGFYSLLEEPEAIDVDTRYGKPSDIIAIGSKDIKPFFYVQQLIESVFFRILVFD